MISLQLYETGQNVETKIATLECWAFKIQLFEVGNVFLFIPLDGMKKYVHTELLSKIFK